MRKNMTPTEARVWMLLRQRRLGYRFRRQHRVGEYIVDFACLERNLVIELDGRQHIDNREDRARDEDLLCRGFRVLRIWNDQALDGAWVEEVIREWLVDLTRGTDGIPWVD